nr:hypothetical protein [Tanacetum cinerariifolium]
MHDIVYPVSIIFTCSVCLLETGDDTVMVVQMVAALCALQTQLLEYNSSCEVSNPNELTHPSATIEVDASLTSLAPLDMEFIQKVSNWQVFHHVGKSMILDHMEMRAKSTKAKVL